MITPNKNHGTRRNGKALRCILCGAMAPKTPGKPTKHQPTCIVPSMMRSYAKEFFADTARLKALIDWVKKD